MTNRLDIDELSKGPRESAEALVARLFELRSRGAGILECIKYVKLNQGCSLREASDVVVNSAAWIDQRDDYLQQQQEMFEEFLDFSRDQIELIQQTIASDGSTTVVIHMKSAAGQDATANDAGT